MSALRCISLLLLLLGGGARVQAQPLAAERLLELELEQVLTLARERAPAVRAALAQAEVSTARVEVARAPLYPSVNARGSVFGFASGDALFTDSASAATAQNSAWLNGSLIAHWTVFDWGKTRAQLTAAAHAADAAHSSLQAEQLVAMLGAAVAFIGVVADDALILALSDAVTQRARQLTITQSQVQVGLRTRLDEQRAHMLVDTASFELAAVRGLRARDASTLASALGHDPAAVLRVHADSRAWIPERWQRAAPASQERPEVNAAAQLVAAARARSAAASAARGLQLDAQLSGSVQLSTAFGGGPVRDTPFAAASLVATLPLFDLERSAAESLADRELHAARAEHARVRTAARSERVQAQLALQAGRELVAQGEKLAALARETLTEVEAHYENGLAEPLAMIDAQNAHTYATCALLRARRDQAIAQLRLAAASGTLAQLAR